MSMTTARRQVGCDIVVAETNFSALMALREDKGNLTADFV